MATAIATRSFARALPRATTFIAATSRLAKRPARHNAVNQFFQNSSRRQYSSAQTFSTSNTSQYLAITTGAALFGGAVYFLTAQQNLAAQPSGLPLLSKNHIKPVSETQFPSIFDPTPADYQNVYNAIAKRIWEYDDYDDGSYAPILLRLSWHCSGTYDATTNTGGSNGATMRFHPESSHGANNGLQHARAFLEPIKQQFPWISYGDLWTLSGVCAIQEMSGPSIPWRPGRQDLLEENCTPDGRLPDGGKTQDHIRAVFGRMGFNDQEMVALCGAHAVGRCHRDRSGFEGPWTFSPTVFTNEFFRLLVEETWGWREWDGKRQYEDKSTGGLMMLPSDMALVQDEEFRRHVLRYAESSEVFFGEFGEVMGKLYELGVPFGEGVERMVLRVSGDEAEG